MASISLFEASLSLFCFLIIFCYFLNKKHFGYLVNKRSPWNWPVLGMLPALVLWSRRIDVLIRVLEKSNLTFLFKGPWFARMDALITVDPANIHHILSSNFSNYIKGPEFKEIVDVFGDPLFTADGDLWKNIKMSSQVILSRQGFQNLSMSVATSKIKDVLLPIFSRFSEEGTVVDLQDVFRRFMFDISLVLVSGSDPQSLSIEMPEVELAEAFEDAGEAIVSRLIIPRFLWKLQNRLGLGKEKKLIEAGATFDRVCAKYIAAKREEIRSQGIHHHDHDGECEDFLTYYIKLDTSKYELLDPSDDKFLRDTILAIIMAIRDTSSSALTWFFWLLSKNPHVEAKIRQEIITNLPKTATSQERPWSATDHREFLNKLVYLHGALYETMRLYPPLPFQRKTSIKSDVLPSGHIVDANSNVIFLVYALGRMRSVWGEDALEFKPERWVSETGELRHEPSSKFLVFNTGPRTCSGKHLAMTSMKTIVVEILQHYDIKLVEGHKIKPKAHLNLLMKHGLRVTLTKRCSA
ncbi:PREDICTED: alkane hydroxylase MAH1-like [Brassica oleracea var. oleracea]|uniref:Cytochrome P450 n=1 Tax=Brassica oleracea var. oleracea TaxID=109376 RepID=A0A0D3BJH4_BRAOL|nr:PREDICTED: alkane hydroxylase MAH1-like [Brassica oleracea var. oleracea]